MIPTVEKFMATDLVSFRPDDCIIDAMRVLLERRISGAPVLDDNGAMIGILSQKDCLSIVYSTAYHQDWGGRVDEFMSTEIEHIPDDMCIIEAAERFIRSNYRRFPVMHDGRLVGQISRQDVMQALDDTYLRDLP